LHLLKEEALYVCCGLLKLHEQDYQHLNNIEGAARKY